MVTIYALMSDDLVLYVGKTKHLKVRERQHRNGSSQCSKYVQEHPDWTMKVLEETTDALGAQREQYFYDTLDPLYNHQRPGQTQEEYNQSESGKRYKKSEVYKASQRAYWQSEKGKEYQRAYWQSDKYKEYQKAYYLKKKLNSVQD